MISFAIKYKTISQIRSKITHYTVGFGEKNDKICLFKVPILLVKVYLAPKNKGKQ